MTETVIIWAFAIVFTFIGIGSFFHFLWIGARWTKTVGQVIGNQVEYAKSGSEQTVYFADIQFAAKNGTVYEIKGDLGRRKPWKIGKNVLVQYKPSFPAHAVTGRPWTRFLFSFSFLFFGLAAWANILGYVS
jgi:hypothetical protein